MSPPQLRYELFPPIYLPYIHRMTSCSYRTLTSFAVLSSYVASYMVSVRQTRGLPRASSRFHVTVGTLAFGYVFTATRSHSGLSPVRVRPCWANKKGTPPKCTFSSLPVHYVLLMHSLCIVVFLFLSSF